MTKQAKINTDIVELVQLISREDVEREFGESAASVVAVDQVVSFAKFILTDDKPNGNGERVPPEEFENIIRTGMYKPIKMAMGEIKDGHDDAVPLGVITNLKQEGNKIVALAALWNHEREDDVARIKNLVNSNKPVNVSWEILYGKAKVVEGVRNLMNTVLKAVTIVGLPAYAGRTQILAVAASKWSEAYVESLPDAHFLHVDGNGDRYFPYRDETGKIDPTRFPPILEEIPSTSLPEEVKASITNQVKRLNSVVTADAGIRELLGVEENFTMEAQELDTKELEGKVAELETKLAEASDTLNAKEAELAQAREEARLAAEKATALEQEIAPLKEFKQQADAELERKEKVASLKKKFGDVGLEKPDTYFEENAEKLLKLGEAELDFMLQEMVAFRDSNKSEASDQSRTTIPNVPGSPKVADLLTMLRERDAERNNK